MSGTQQHKFILLTILCLAFVIGCGSSSFDHPGIVGPHYVGPVTSVEVTPDGESITVGDTIQFSAKVTFADTSRTDVTPFVDWSSSNPSVASIESTGLATALAPGQTTISASYEDYSESVSLTVVSAPKPPKPVDPKPPGPVDPDPEDLGILEITVEPSVALTAPGSQRRYTATALFLDGDVQDVTDLVEWSSDSTDVEVTSASDDPDKAGIANVDLAASTASSVQVSATLGDVSGVAHLNIGSFLYVANLGSASTSVGVYSVDPHDGGLTYLDQEVTPETRPVRLTMDPTGRFLYVTNFEPASSLMSYAIDATTGMLTEIQSPISFLSTVYGLVMDAKGRFVYVYEFADKISVYTLDQSSGELHLSTTINFDDNLTGIETHPNGHFFYISTINSDGHTEINTYVTDQQTGNLTPQSVPLVTVDQQIAEMVVDPTGHYLYVSEYGSGGNNVHTFFIDQTDGGLTPVASLTGLTDPPPDSLCIDPYSRFLYAGASSFTDYKVGAFSIGQTDGALTQLSSIVADPDKSSMQPTAVTVEPTGRYLYSSNQNQTVGSVSVMTIDQITGELSNARSFTAGSYTYDVILTP